jgi:hypothetical protein
MATAQRARTRSSSVLHAALQTCAAKAIVAIPFAVITAAVSVPALSALAQGRPAEVVAIRELQLKEGADRAQFERFVRATYNPGWEGAVPGLKAYIALGDRGEKKGSYALVLIFDSSATRDAIYPKEGGGASDKFAPLLKKPFALNAELEKYLEPASLSVYTDYVPLR